LAVSDQKEEDWIFFLRKTKKNLSHYVTSCGIMRNVSGNRFLVSLRKFKNIEEESQ